LSEYTAAERALLRLCEDVAAEVGWARAAEIKLALEGPSAAVTAELAAEGAARGGELSGQAELPPLCTKPNCFHDTLACDHPLMRRHLIGGHAGNRALFISAGSTEPPKGSSSPRGRRGR
jgi:hypothetical protein